MSLKATIENESILADKKMFVCIDFLETFTFAIVIIQPRYFCIIEVIIFLNKRIWIFINKIMFLVDPCLQRL